LGRFFKNNRRSAGNAASLYGAIVAQARSPGFYLSVGVPDTTDGRFELVVLHVILVVRRLRGEGDPEAQGLGQDVFDYFCLDMDRTLREMGIGDLGVPKKMKAVGEAFYGRASAYEPSLSTGDVSSLAAAFARNILPASAPEGAATRLAAYAVAAAEALSRTSDEDIASARVAFPAIDALAETEGSS
jgi:cytochrome b pre-mRNA-processing protein 3